MSHGMDRLINMAAVQYCKLSSFRNGVENLTSPLCRVFFQICNRRAICSSQRHSLNLFSHRSIKNYSQQTQPRVSNLRGQSDQVILFTNHNTKFLKVVNLFGFSFAGFWFFTAYQFATMRVTPAAQRNSMNLPWYARFDIVSSESAKMIVTALAGFLGCAVLGGAWMYSLRSVGKVILEKGGKSATIVTFNPMTLSMSRVVRADMSEISCQGHRSINDVVPVKIRGHRMHFLLSREGVYHNGPLFDRSVGLRRSL